MDWLAAITSPPRPHALGTLGLVDTFSKAAF